MKILYQMPLQRLPCTIDHFVTDMLLVKVVCLKIDPGVVPSGGRASQDRWIDFLTRWLLLLKIRRLHG